MNDRRPGDRGMTTLSGSGMVSKADERVMLIGTMDELNCYIGIVKTEIACSHLNAVLERIQRTLMQISDGVRTQYNREAVPSLEEVHFLEQEIEWLRTETEDAESVLPGTNREAAVLELAASVARRTERALITVDRRFGVRAESRQYMNRLADYFDLASAYRRLNPSEKKGYSGGFESHMVKTESKMEQVVRQVMTQMGVVHEITLEQAKMVMEEVEQEAARRGMNTVICICNAHGNPVAVHVMDGAFLVSFDAARKKAYSSAAVKMSTMELAKLAAPGETFYGVDKLDDGKITLIGGGMPLISGGVLCGAIGVSGGTGEEDHSLAEYALEVYKGICG